MSQLRSPITHALLLAAGRGDRMRPLTDEQPKPLLRAGGRSLIEWQLAALARAGIGKVVVNLAHLGQALEDHLGNGHRYGLAIRYSREGASAAQALETLGGIALALPLLGNSPFVVASADILSDFDYRGLAPAAEAIAAQRRDAHLVLVDNPPFHPAGDFGLDHGLASLTPPFLTYGNIGVYAPRLFLDVPVGQKMKLFPWMNRFIGKGRVGAEHYSGPWRNVGTPGQLAEADDWLRHARGTAAADLAAEDAEANGMGGPSR